MRAARRKSILGPPGALALVIAACTATAAIIASADGSGNTTAFAPAPDWRPIGARNGDLAVVCLRAGPVITADHVVSDAAGSGGVLDPVVPVVPGSKVEIPVANRVGDEIRSDPGLAPVPLLWRRHGRGGART